MCPQRMSPYSIVFKDEGGKNSKEARIEAQQNRNQVPENFSDRNWKWGHFANPEEPGQSALKPSEMQTSLQWLVDVVAPSPELYVDIVPPSLTKELDMLGWSPE